MAQAKIGKETQILAVVIVLFAVLIGVNFFLPALKPVPLPNNNSINELPQQPESPANEPEAAVPPVEEPAIPIVQTCAEQNGSICNSVNDCTGNILPSSDSLNCCSISCKIGDAQKPTVFIQSPENRDQVSGYFVEVKAIASDNVGVTRVDFLIDGDLNASLTSRPFNFSWDTRKFARGDHYLNIKAFDEAGNFGLASIVVNLR